MMVSPATEFSGPDWLPVGEEPLAPHNITHYAIQRYNGISALSMPSGDIDAAREDSAVTGLYHQDTRYLSQLLLSFGGVRPMLLDSREVDGVLGSIFTNPAMRSARTGVTVPAQTLVLRRRRVLSDALLEAVTVSNYGLEPVDTDLRIRFAMDFADIFEVRGYQRTSAVPEVTRTPAGDHVDFSCTGVDGTTRAGVIWFSPQPERLTEGEANFNVRLAPRETFSLTITASPQGLRRPGEPSEASRKVARERDDWLSEVTEFTSDDELLNAAVRRALVDIHSLKTVTPEHEYLAAGVPWFDTLFGRDSLISGIELLAWDPSLLKTSLRVLAGHQATDTDPVHDAQPGKIPHELRWGELASAGEVPFARYYGSVDATPLFVMAAWEYVRWTGDKDTIRDIWPNLQRAIDWCLDQSDASALDCLCYARISARGLENQGWKDSHDAIAWPDGRLVDGPIALVEVQAYLVAALRAFANLAATLGREEAGMYLDRASDFAAMLNGSFVDPGAGYALCLDGKGRPVPTVASNAGHVLWSGAARPELAERVARRLLEPDMFSGWGVRTLASTMGRYNPLGYHVGSVWPHDNALFLAGLRWYGFDDHADRLASSLLQAAVAFPDLRMPELFSGDDRELRLVPTPYPVASRPQAWSAASVAYILTSMLGLRPGRQRQLAVVRPQLPGHLRWVRLRNLRFAGGQVDLSFRRTGSRVAVEAESITPGVELVLSEHWPEESGTNGMQLDVPWQA